MQDSEKGPEQLSHQPNNIHVSVSSEAKTNSWRKKVAGVLVPFVLGATVAVAGYIRLNQEGGLPDNAEVDIEREPWFNNAISRDLALRADTGPTLNELIQEAAEESGAPGHGYQNYEFTTTKDVYALKGGSVFARQANRILDRTPIPNLQDDNWRNIESLSATTYGTTVARAPREGIEIAIDNELIDQRGNPIPDTTPSIDTMENATESKVITITVNEVEILENFIRYNTGNSNEGTTEKDVHWRRVWDYYRDRGLIPDTLQLATDGHVEADEILRLDHSGYVVLAAACDAVNNYTAAIEPVLKDSNEPYQINYDVAPAIQSHLRLMERRASGLGEGVHGPAQVTEATIDRAVRQPRKCEELTNQDEYNVIVHDEVKVGEGQNNVLSFLEGLTATEISDADLGTIELEPIYLDEDEIEQ